MVSKEASPTGKLPGCSVTGVDCGCETVDVNAIKLNCIWLIGGTKLNKLATAINIIIGAGHSTFLRGHLRSQTLFQKDYRTRPGRR